MKHSLAYSPSNSKQTDVMYIPTVSLVENRYVIFSIPEANNVTLTRKIAWGLAGSMALAELETVKRPYKQVYVKNEQHIRFQDLLPTPTTYPPKNASLATKVILGSAKVGDLEWLPKRHDTIQRSDQGAVARKVRVS